MKNTLLITQDFPPVKGGVSTSLWNFFSYFPKKGSFVLTSESIMKFNESPNIVRKKLFFSTGYFWPKWLPSFFHTLKFVKRYKIDLIQVGQILPFGTICLILRKFIAVNFITFVYGQDLLINTGRWFKMYLIKKILQKSKYIVANSNFTKQIVVSLGVDKEKIIVAYPCPKLQNTNIDSNNLKNFKNNHNLVNKRVVLTVGNLVKRKGHQSVISLLPRLIKKFPNLIYLIVGDGPEKRNIENTIKLLKLEKNVCLLGRVSDELLPLIYTVSNFFIMPIKNIKNIYGNTIDAEGFGLVFLEAALYGKTSLSTISGGVGEAIINGKTGILVNQNNTNELYSAMLYLLQNQEKCTTLGLNAKKRLFNEFNPMVQSNKILAISK